MSRYIEVNDVANAIYHHFPSIRTMADARGIIEEAPSIDIVRCKECKFSESVITSWSTDGKNNVVERLCKVHKWSVKDDDYCSYAERKENE